MPTFPNCVWMFGTRWVGRVQKFWLPMPFSGVWDQIRHPRYQELWKRSSSRRVTAVWSWADLENPGKSYGFYHMPMITAQSCFQMVLPHEISWNTFVHHFSSTTNGFWNLIFGIHNSHIFSNVHKSYFLKKLCISHFLRPKSTTRCLNPLLN